MSGFTRHHRLMLGAVLAALFVRALFAFAYWVDRPLTIDETEYMMLAARVVEGEGLTFPPGERRLMRSPGYPLFVAATQFAAPGRNTIKAAQCLLGALTVLLVAALAGRLAGASAAAAAAWMAALYPPLVFQPAYVLSESLYALLALGCVLSAWTLLAGRPDDPATRALPTGLLGGATLLVRPEFALFLGPVGLLLLWRRRMRAAAVLAATVFLAVAPWPAWNLARGEVVLMSGRGGPNFWMGNNALALGDGDVSANPPMAHAYVRLMEGHPDHSPQDLERLFYREAADFIRSEPLAWAALMARKAFWFVVPFGPSYQSRSMLFFVTHAASWLALAAAVCAAVWRRGLPPTPPVLWMAAASVALTALFFFPLERYRVPVLDPLLIALLSAAVFGARHGRARTAGPPLQNSV